MIMNWMDKRLGSSFAIAALCAMLVGSLTLLPASSNAQATVDLAEVFPASPFTEQYEKRLFAWIASEVTSERLPFCWRASQGRGVGVVPTGNCPSGQTNDAGLCYESCRSEYSGFATTCTANCPTGYRDDGLFCGKPTPATYIPESFALWDKNKCDAKYGQGCHQLGAVIYPRCPSGFKQVGLNCQAECPAGWDDAGVSCTKPTYQRGVGATTLCPAGMESDAGLCYAQCENPNYSGVGPVCWQNCPIDRPHDCGAGCTLNEGTCAKDVAEMVVSPIMAAISIATLLRG